MRGTFPGWKACLYSLLSLLVPGLGHLALGLKGRAAAFFALVAAMFALGISLDGALFSFSEGNLLFKLAGIGEMGLGALYWLSRAIGWGVLDGGQAAKLMFGYGNTCLVSAGLMNMLLMMDVYDIAVGRKP